MSEFPSSESQNESETVRRQSDAIRGFVAARVNHEPLPESQAEYEIAAFGLQPGAYTVFVDTVSEFGGGFKRFVPIDGMSEPLDGMTFAHTGGPSHDLNRSLHNMLLKPNGDVIGRISTENSEGRKFTEISWSASSTDPKARGAHKRHVNNMFVRGEAMMRGSESHPPHVNRGEYRQPLQARKRGGGLLRLLRRG